VRIDVAVMRQVSAEDIKAARRAAATKPTIDWREEPCHQGWNRLLWGDCRIEISGEYSSEVIRNARGIRRTRK